MFSRNEKYGQALHLQYGFDFVAQDSQAKTKSGFWAMLKTFFHMNNSAETTQPSTGNVEVDLDRTTIEQAVKSELRNIDAAANENQQELFNGKIA
ncbi:hypothetical protein [Sneathiella sp.]|uniref:hypothetical protein n=1 Tax=Sneathiella sp. TaxID=1964365 RepID=UPI0039E3BFD6